MSTTAETPAPAARDVHDVIRVVGARVNNLRDVTIEIPKRRLTVFTGVSGSGKSSLVFDTVAAESQRLINETYSSFLQGFMPSLARPDVDVLEGLTTAIIVDQQRMGADPRSTVGTATDANAMLRILFSRLGKPHIGSAQAFSFNVASISGSGAVSTTKGGQEVKERRSFSITGGMCPRCEGRGAVNDIDLTELYDDTLSLGGGALKVPGYSMDGWYGRIFVGAGFDLDLPIARYPPQQLTRLLHAEPTKIKVEGVNLTHEGLIPRLRKSVLSKDVDALQPHVRAFVERAVTFSTCPECEGTRLTAAARSSRIDGLSIADACALQISDLAAWVRGLREPSVAPLVESLGGTLDSFAEIGLGYLSLDRASGPSRAARPSGPRWCATSARRSPTSPTSSTSRPIGLHPHDIQRMNGLLLRLRDKGNTVLVVEHKPEAIVIADHVVDLGPGAGTAGGKVVLRGHRRRPARERDRDRAPPRGPGPAQGRRSARPRARWRSAGRRSTTCATSTSTCRSGCWSSSPASPDRARARWCTARCAAARAWSWSTRRPIKGSRRSNPATYTGLLEPIRKAFAKANGVKPALFSANSEGACPACNGAGVVYTDLAMMAGVATTCEVCEGRRFSADVLEHRYGGRDISQVLAMPVVEAEAFFGAGEGRVPVAQTILGHLVDVGLGYVSLGQPLTTLSGGERQRLKLATHLGDQGEVVVLDEPTTGLHLADVDQLLALLDRLVDGGESLVVSSTTRPSWPTPTGSSTSVPAPGTRAGGSSSRAPRPTWSPRPRPGRASTWPPTWPPEPPEPPGRACGAGPTG